MERDAYIFLDGFLCGWLFMMLGFLVIELKGPIAPPPPA